MYRKEGNMYIFSNGNDETIFSTDIVGLLTQNGKVIKHGAAARLKPEYIKVMNSGGLFSMIESAEFEINNLNKLTSGIPPTI